MKTILLLIIFLSIQLFESNICFSQTTPTKHIETSRYRINTEGAAFSSIEINIAGKWSTHEITNEPIGNFEFTAKEIDLNRDGSEELVLNWENRTYGTGGGTFKKGFQIWDLENAKLLFSAIILCGEESFGKAEVPHFLNTCERKIEIKDSQIHFASVNCEIQNREHNGLHHHCSLTEIEPGIYSLENKTLQKN